MKSARVAPRWFVAALRRIDRRLTIYWNDRKGTWEIAERTRRIFVEGMHNGKPIQKLGDRWNRILYVKDVGSKILEFIKRIDMSRFENTQQMIDELEIDASEAPA